jgi:two-component system, chemotaxis family, response regulator Rcp1
VQGPVDILLVEDSPGDARLMVETFKELSTPTTLHLVGDGVEALPILRQADRYAQVPRPRLVLLDLNRPRRDGREVLAEVKVDPVLRQIPVLDLSTSQSRDDVMDSDRLRANCCMTEPADLDDFLELVRRIERFWLGVAHLPTG